VTSRQKPTFLVVDPNSITSRLNLKEYANMTLNTILRRAMTVVIAAVTSMSFAAEDDPAKKDLKKFEGIWQVTSLEINGNKADESDVKKMKVINKPDGVMAIEIDGNFSEHGQLKIYPTQKPKTVDLTVTEGTSKGKTMLGIYEFDGETRKVCYAEFGKERPTNFSAAEGTGRFLLVLKRMK
jgi:uncharacterized protein (TIGR03067 family)